MTTEEKAAQYRNPSLAFVKHRKSIKLVTFRGVSGADSWRRNGNPLLFDSKWQPKPAFNAAIATAPGKR